MFKQCIILFAIYSFSILHGHAQHLPIPSNEIQVRLEKLNTLGSVLYFAAHPDDENTKLIAWLAQEKKYRTGYLSLTRGDGGQNLIGTEQGIALGLIRTQELLAARNIDKGEQFFSSAYDFGFSKTAAETFNFWDKNTALREAVWIIRRFQPDVIINRFPPDERGGHGHHQASAILAKEAFVAAADPNMFPDQLKEVQPWQAKRLLWNTANFGGANNTAEDQLKIDIGTYSPLLGKSYGEISATSRSQHKSQGFGSASSRGTSIEYFDFVAGSKPEKDLMEGVETSWKRIPNTAPIQHLIDALNREYQPNHPERSVPQLFALKALIQTIDNQYWKTQKIKEIDFLIQACAGLWIDATAPNMYYAQRTAFEVNVEAIVLNPGLHVELLKVNDMAVNSALTTNVLWRGKESYSWPSTTQPYWLNQPHSLGKFSVEQKDLGNPTNSQKPAIQLTFKIEGHDFTVTTPIQHKKVDPVQGETYQDIAIVPPITATLSTTNIISINGAAQKLNITFTRQDDNIASFVINTDKMTGWEVTPQTIQLDFGNQRTLSKEITLKPLSTTAAAAQLRFTWNKDTLRTIETIQYDHIPMLSWYPIAEAKVQNLQIINPIKRIAYIAGAGDLVPQALNQIGIETTLLHENQLSVAALQQFDAVVVGIRYFNISDKGDHTQKVLMQYVAEGGVALIQYNVNARMQVSDIGPYPFVLTRTRVTEEHAAVQFDKKDPALQYPNQITALDFEGWVQERGLYFADQIDNKYRTPLLIADDNENPSKGALLLVNYGKGKFVYTSLAFFRQLPAGVPGAYRLFVNLLTKEK